MTDDSGDIMVTLGSLPSDRYGFLKVVKESSPNRLGSKINCSFNLFVYNINDINCYFLYRSQIIQAETWTNSTVI